MARRAWSPYFASLLLLLQLGMAPFTHAAGSAYIDADCAGMTQVDAVGMAAGDCDHMTAGTDGARLPDGHSRPSHSHASCSCPCAHTPALGTVRLFVLDPEPPVAAERVLVTPAFDTPVFKLLRPPK